MYILSCRGAPPAIVNTLVMEMLRSPNFAPERMTVILQQAEFFSAQRAHTEEYIFSPRRDNRQGDISIYRALVNTNRIYL